VEVFEDGGKMNKEGCCTIITVSINLTAARTVILFTYYFMIIFNSNSSSASKSIIWFLSFRFN